MRANARPPIWSSPDRCRAACAAWLRPARSPFPERPPVRLAVIGAVAPHLLRPRQTHRERDAAAFNQQVMLAAEFAPVYRAFARLLAPVAGPDSGAVNDGSLPRQSPFGPEFREDALPQPAPDAPRVPFEEPAAAGVARREVARRGQRLPRHPGLEDEDDAGHHPARVSRLSPRVLNVAPLLRLWEQRLDALPQLIGEDRVGHTANSFV